MHELSIGTTKLRVVVADITDLDVDVIVNAANSSLLGGGGVDGAIHRAAGPELLEECRRLVARQGECPTGCAVITGGGRLAARHVVHTVGPVWTGRSPAEHDRQLASCYVESLRLAEGVGAESIAFPNISTGVYRFPKPRAASVALRAVRRHVEPGTSLTDVVFACFDDVNRDLYVAGLT